MHLPTTSVFELFSAFYSRSYVMQSRYAGTGIERKSQQHMDMCCPLRSVLPICSPFSVSTGCSSENGLPSYDCCVHYHFKFDFHFQLLSTLTERTLVVTTLSSTHVTLWRAPLACTTNASVGQILTSFIQRCSIQNYIGVRSAVLPIL